MPQYEIQSGIPIPPDVNVPSRVRKGSYPFSKMKIFDSFFIPCKDQNNVANELVKIKKKVLSALYSYNKRQISQNKIKAAVGAHRSNGVEGIRVWRTEFDV